jgi:hypothetical protein
MGQALKTKKQNASKKASKPEGFECAFCGKVLRFETGLLKHVCKEKKRYLERGRQDVRFGYIAYRIFYEVHYPTRTSAASVETFEKSSVYDAFVRFGKYIVDVNAIAPEEFIRYVVRSRRSVDSWCSDTLYLEYVRLLNKFESYDRALERTLLVAESWANKENSEIKDFFRGIAPSLAVHWMMSGRISPWVIFNCDSGRELLERFSDEQFELLEKAIDLKFWKKKFLEHLDEVHHIQDFLASEGI